MHLFRMTPDKGDWPNETAIKIGTEPIFDDGMALGEEKTKQIQGMHRGSLTGWFGADYNAQFVDLRLSASTQERRWS